MQTNGAREAVRWAVMLCLLLWAAFAPARSEDLQVQRWTQPGDALEFADVQGRSEGWGVGSASASLFGPRRQGGSRWWRVQFSEPSAGADAGPWILSLRESFDARLTLYLPPEYRPQSISLFDPALQQIGSRHRLAVLLQPEQRLQPVYLQIVSARGQPIGLSAEPMAQYLRADLDRVRFTQAMLAAMLLLAIVGTIFALALKRRILLLLCVWIVSSAVYFAALSGELVELLGSAMGGASQMMIIAVASHIGLLAAYVFVYGFLDIGRYFPRLAKLFQLLLWAVAALTVGAVFSNASSAFALALNVTLIALVSLALGMAMRLIWLGNRQARFYLLGWGLVALSGLLRAGYFVAERGTPEWLELLHPAMNTVGALVLVLAIARAARYAEREMHSARRSARTDPLTGLPNRAELDSGLPARAQRAAAEQRAMSVLFIDLDQFKRVNDRFGHDVGDQCLAAAARSLKRHVRASDLLARYGGEEFVLLLEGAELAAAQRVAASLRASIEQDCADVGGHLVEMTVSIGIAELRSGETAADLLRRADEALYRAKSEGRNRFIPALPQATAA